MRAESVGCRATFGWASRRTVAQSLVACVTAV